MKHDFSAQFLRVLPPDTNLGEAWESLCFDLLCAELNDHDLMRLAPPDCGVDILSRMLHHAYQCKCDERGAFGSLSATESIGSLTTAWKHKKQLGWQSYFFCTNAHYTGNALAKIGEAAEAIGLDPSRFNFKGPEYWDELCARHFGTVADRLDYRITASVGQVMSAFEQARYLDRYLKEFEEKIRNAQFSVVIKNNRTPVEIVVPFSPELTVRNCLHVAQQILGVSLEWTNFPDLGTSAGPSLSLTIDRTAQDFSQKISDLALAPGDKLELWVKIVWRDETQKTGMDESAVMQRMCYDMLTWDRPEVLRASVSPAERRQMTLERAEELIQSMIWTGAKRLRGNG